MDTDDNGVMEWVQAVGDSPAHATAGQLCALGAAWGAGSSWTILCGRYNYNNEAFENPALTMLPAFSEANFHLLQEYAILNFNDRGL